MNINCLQKLGIIQASLQTFIAKSQDTKMGNTIYINLVLYFSTLYIIKRRYCVKIYFGHFWPPNFCLIPALYVEIPDLYSYICLSSSTVPET